MSDTALSLLYLSEPDAVAAGVTDMAPCVEAMDETLQLLQLGDYRMGGKLGNSHGAMVMFAETSEFPNMPTDGPDRRFMAMPAYLGGSFDNAGVKWYGSNMENRDKGLPRSIHVFVLNDKDTGAPKMIMSANLLSAYRTGAVPGVGAKYLARPGSEVVSIIGPGVMGKTGLEAYAAVCPITRAQVYGRRKVTAEAYKEWAAERLPDIEIVVCDTLEESVRGADIIHSGVSGLVDPAVYPHVLTEWLKPGAFICSVANLKLDDELLLDPKTGLFIDNIGMYFDWQEEFGYPAYETTTGIIGTRFVDLIHDGLLDQDRVVNIGDVPLGRKPGRTSDDQIIVFSVGGMPIEDVAWSTVVYRKAKELGIGVELPFWDVPALA
ncbi:tyramine oxidase subunit B [Propionicicella superfundia]|uniref:tyramine oxidase subunit B n=1 Tax=Propionicicella superfundia TaxID=348582 RepID=UPI0003FF2EA9|nr:tyramine oxidase subunit B [Propionicicella superfundia]